MRMLVSTAILTFCGLSSLSVPPAAAQTPAARTPAVSGDQLAGSLRQFLVEYMPTPLYEKSTNWGKTHRVANGLEFKGKGLKVKPKVQYKEKNDGTWKKVWVTADNPQRDLVLTIANVQQPEPGRLAFNLYASQGVHVHYQQIVWESGLKLYDGTARARLRIKANLQCECTSRLERKDGPLPDLVFRLRILKADVAYDQFELQHVAGVGGELAQIIGRTIKETVEEVKPTLARDLLAKAEAAIVKAGDTKEIRIGLGSLFK